MIDGIWKRPFALRELVGELARDPSGVDRPELLRRWIAAELELATQGR